MLGFKSAFPRASPLLDDQGSGARPIDRALRTESSAEVGHALSSKMSVDHARQQWEMARPEGQTSNSLLETLVDCTAYLEARDDRPAYSQRNR
jgi:hypothetical protein